MKKQLKTIILAAFLLISNAIEANTLMSPGTAFEPVVVESARELTPHYPSSATLVLSELSYLEEIKIIDLMRDENRFYLTIKRNISVSQSNWKWVGVKKAFNIWQLHIKSPGAVGMQAFFDKANLMPGLKIKIYSGQRAITSHVGEHSSDVSTNAKSFWSTRVPGDTIVIEVWVPQDNDLKPHGFPFEIKSINHYFRDGSGDIPNLKHYSAQQQQQQQNTCNPLNNQCIRDNDRAYSAVGIMTYTQSRGITQQCTGSFLNDHPTDSELYFLTAFHCIEPGFSENTARGRDVNAQIRTSFSPCSTSSADRLVVDDIKFIAASEIADWALLWVNKADLKRADGLSLPANSPALLGWNATTPLATGSFVETLHHAGGYSQSYARFEMTALKHVILQDYNGNRTLFSSCRNTTGCTHYEMNAIIGGMASGASGSSLWGPRYQVRAVFTNSNTSGCSISASRFDKIYEDGRVSCSLNNGNAYYPRNTSRCDDSARPLYDNNPPSLSRLSLSIGTLHPSFSNTITRYLAAVPINATQITLRLNTANNSHKINVNGNSVTGAVTIPLRSGSNTINIAVQTADDSETNNYTIEVIRLAQQNFNPVGTWESTAIENINIQCPLLPNLTADDIFDSVGSEYEVVETSGRLLNIIDNTDSQRYTEISRQIPNRYTFELRYQDTDDDITTNITDTVALILSSDEDVTGTGILTIGIVGLEDIFSCQATYTVKLKKQKQASSILKNISLSSGTLTPSFNGETKNYMATVGSDVGQLTITIGNDHQDQTITVNGTIISGGVNPTRVLSTTVPLNVGNNTITIRVTSADGIATSIYTLRVSRPRPILTGLSLSAGQFQPNFRSGIAQYAATVGSDVTQIGITAAADSNTHTISFNGSQSNIVPLNVGNNPITIRITTADGIATSIYTLEVSRPRPALTGLSLSAGQIQPSFSSEMTQYTAIVSNDMPRIDITATANGNTHALTFNSSQSNIVPLNVGDNTIAIRITTADGMAMADYNLAIRRLSTATLTGLTAEVNSQLLTLRPNFSTIVLDYKASIESTMTRLILRPTADTGRMIRIRYTPQEGTAIDQSISSGNSISIMPFFYGENNIYIDVTHNSAMESYVLHVLLGLRVRAKLFLEGPLR